MKRIDNRLSNEIRPIQITPHFIKNADGSVLIEMGNTRIICNATLLPNVPQWLQGQGTGWVTAEYALMPQSTSTRVARERTSLSGRTQEIQRLIGRSLRAAVDLQALGERAIIVDADVIEADGGTRTASIIGGFVALALCLQKLKIKENIKENLLKHKISAISIGVLHGEPLLDLCYQEDSNAEVDMNIVMQDASSFIEIQGTGEKTSFDRKTLDLLLDWSQEACTKIQEIQVKHIGPVLP
ncbi:MAG: ribonuclease PH [Fibrobacter sp.]|jgi:ribonuclease PH|nr:ribonuclease PH [Fibrobacter sp.]